MPSPRLPWLHTTCCSSSSGILTCSSPTSSSSSVITLTGGVWFPRKSQPHSLANVTVHDALSPVTALLGRRRRRRGPKGPTPPTVNRSVPTNRVLESLTCRQRTLQVYTEGGRGRGVKWEGGKVGRKVVKKGRGEEVQGEGVEEG